MEEVKRTLGGMEREAFELALDSRMEEMLDTRG